MISDIRRFLRHSAIYAIGNIANRLGAFILLPLYTNYLTTSQYGMLEIFYSVNSVVASLLGFGLAHASLRFFFEYKDERESGEVISTSIISAAVISTIGVGIALLFRERISLVLFDSARYSNLFFFGLGIIVAEISTQINYAYLRAKEYSAVYVCVTLTTMVIQVICNVIMVSRFNMGVQGILMGNFIAIYSSWAFLTVFTFSKCGTRFSWHKLKEMVSYSYPMLLGIIVGSVLGNADRFLLKALGSMESVGVYSLAIKLTGVLAVILLDPFQKNFGPYRFSIMNREDAPLIYSRITSYLLFAMTYLGLGFSMFITDILRWMSKPEYWDAAKIVPIACLGLVFACLSYPFQTGILIGKKTKSLFFITSTIGTIAVLLDLLLIPRLFAYGAAISAVIATIAGTSITYFVSQRIYPIKYDFLSWGKAVVLGAACYYVSLFVPDRPIFLSICGKAALALVFPAGLYFLKCFYPDEIDGAKRMVSAAVRKAKAYGIAAG